MSLIGVVNYGAGNITSVINMLDFLGAKSKKINQPEHLFHCDRIILPGVGAAGFAIENLKKNNFDQALNEVVLKNGVPFLGICLGMQLLAERIYEFGIYKGLGWLQGKVIPLNELIGNKMKIPHIGWSSVIQNFNDKMFFSNNKKYNKFYFAHSNTLILKDKNLEYAHCIYKKNLVAAVKKNNIFAVQFHPEKSQISGEILLSNFLKWRP